MTCQAPWPSCTRRPGGPLGHEGWLGDELRVATARLRVAAGEPDVALLEVEDVRSARSERDVALVRVEVALDRHEDGLAANCFRSSSTRTRLS